MNKKCCVALVALSGVLTARAAAPTVTSVTIADGGEMTFDVASAANTSGASASPHILFLEGSGTIRLENAGSSCAVNPCIFATNGTDPSGQPQPGLYRLVSAGGGLDSPTWSYDLPKGAKVKSVTATDILMKVAGGLLLLLR